MAVATDYDAPRRTRPRTPTTISLEALNARRTDTQSSAVDVDETDLNEALELPGADLSNRSEDELTVRVVPQQADEFTCTNLLPRSRLSASRQTNSQYIVWRLPDSIYSLVSLIDSKYRGVSKLVPTPTQPHYRPPLERPLRTFSGFFLAIDGEADVEDQDTRHSSFEDVPLIVDFRWRS